jgi:hypothetical protein
MPNSLLCPPDVCWPPDAGECYRPSWSCHGGLVNDEHVGIWQATDHIAGWQSIADSEKLYEMAVVSGSIILEIGTYAGRSAVVELRGSLFAQQRDGKPRPQFYGIDVDSAALTRSYATLHAANLAEYALLYHGDLSHFHRDVPITPTMVFVDGSHEYSAIWSDLQGLRFFLAPGTPILCHDYVGCPGVKRAVEEWSNTGFYEWMGRFGCSALLRAGPRCSGQVCGLPAEQFERECQRCLANHFTRLGQEHNALQQRVTQLQERVQELQECVNEHSASRWRRLGLKMGVAKETTWERTRLARGS